MCLHDYLTCIHDLGIHAYLHVNIIDLNQRSLSGRLTDSLGVLFPIPSQISDLIVIAIGDDYIFAFFGLVTKL